MVGCFALKAGITTERYLPLLVIVARPTSRRFHSDDPVFGCALGT